MDNVVLVTVDCLRADAVGCYGCEKPTTPSIDSMADQGSRFANCFANGGSTAFSIPSLFGSVYHTMLDGPRFPASVPLVAEVFASAGYTTVGINAANPNLTPEFGYDAGYDRFVDFVTAYPDDESIAGVSPDEVGERDSKPTEDGGQSLSGRTVDFVRDSDRLYDIIHPLYQFLFYRLPNPYRKLRSYVRYLGGKAPNAMSEYVCPRADEVVDLAIKWLEAGTCEEPFFLWIHLMDPHSWYDPDAALVQELYGSDVSRFERFLANRALMSASPFRGDPDVESVKRYMDPLQKLYHGAVRQADRAVGRLDETLESTGVADDTVLCVTSDHGEQFLEHGGVQHGGNVHTELIHVPLVVTGPGIPDATVETPVGLLDLPPTLADLAGVDASDRYLGDSVVAFVDGERDGERTVISAQPAPGGEVAVRDSRYTYITVPDEDEPRVYDRHDDPYEQEPLASPNSTATNRLADALDAYQTLVNDTDFESKDVAPSSAVEERLENLGYK